jgi:hypothetical protein
MGYRAAAHRGASRRGWAACGLIRITRMRNGNHEDSVV